MPPFFGPVRVLIAGGDHNERNRMLDTGISIFNDPRLAKGYVGAASAHAQEVIGSITFKG